MGTARHRTPPRRAETEADRAPSMPISKLRDSTVAPAAQGGDRAVRAGMGSLTLLPSHP